MSVLPPCALLFGTSAGQKKPSFGRIPTNGSKPVGAGASFSQPEKGRCMDPTLRCRWSSGRQPLSASNPIDVFVLD